MIASQLNRVTGVPVSGRNFLPEVVSFARHITSIQLSTTLLASGVLAFLFAVQPRWHGFPGPLVAVVAVTVIVWGSGLNVEVIGSVPSGLPSVHVPTLRLSDVRDLIGPAFSVLVIAFSDVVLTGRAFAGPGERINANNELLALGVSNVVVSFVRGFPVSSSASRTAIGKVAGSRTQLYSVTAAVVVAVVLLFGHTILAHFPQAALVSQGCMTLTTTPALGRFRASWSIATMRHCSSPTPKTSAAGR